MSKYSDDLGSWLCELNYSTCFFVAGGNIMHLIESFSNKLVMIPVIHEVAAVIAADYFNEASSANGFKQGKSLALVTAGPGVTNVVTGVAGAYIDSRELLVIGGQVKAIDLKLQNERQRGIQEVDGVELLSSVVKQAVLINKRMGEEIFKKLVTHAGTARKGPVYFEICLDVQGSISSFEEDRNNFQEFSKVDSKSISPGIDSWKRDILESIRKAKRPIFLIGGGFPRDNEPLTITLKNFGIPIATTWHGADRVEANFHAYAGRPNMFGQRWANIVIQQADLIVVLGSSLGTQQTGFNYSEFAPEAVILQIDVDDSSFKVERFERLIPLRITIEDFISVLEENFSNILEPRFSTWSLWNAFVQEVRHELPLVEKVTDQSNDYINPFRFIEFLSGIAPNNLNFVPCSSGGSYTSAMQVFEHKKGNLILSSRGLGSMGIGLAGSIGAALGNGNLTWLIEGDGGILQNIQELGTLSLQNLPIKVIVFGNDGYASIRGTQKKYFAGNYVGCDTATGLGLPDFKILAGSFGLRSIDFKLGDSIESLTNDLLSSEPIMIYVSISPDQAFLPKIESRLSIDGSMESNPLHIMFPPLDPDLNSRVLKFLNTQEAIHE